MASPLTRDEIQELPTTPYAELRGQLQSGDLLFCSGDYYVSKMIQAATGSPWSHVGIIAQIESINRILLLESVEDMGVRFAPLSKYSEDYENGEPYQGELVIARVREMNPSLIKLVLQRGADNLTLPYDKDELLKILYRIMVGHGRLSEDREYICSELVYECFLKAGVNFGCDPRGFISPENIWCDPDVFLLARVEPIRRFEGLSIAA